MNKMNQQMKRESDHTSPQQKKESLFIIKIGGNIIDHPEELQSFLADFSRIEQKKILIHGGGKIASKIGEKLDIKSDYKDGRRITDGPTLELVTMVYGGLVNKKLVAELQALKVPALGMSGCDGNLLSAIRRPVEKIDYGWVGDLGEEGVNMDLLQLLLENDLVPVLAPLTHDGLGHMLNTNADTIAARIAVKASQSYAVRMIFCFEKRGVLLHPEDPDSVIGKIDQAIYQDLLKKQVLSEGILPKLDNAFDAISKGVKEVLIGHARNILQNITDRVSGTLIQ
ncbi:MAG: acetylglutamate kinase [Chitinophagaceae bacterium]